MCCELYECEVRYEVGEWNKEQLITMDILALETMKNAAKCDR